MKIPPKKNTIVEKLTHPVKIPVIVNSKKGSFNLSINITTTKSKTIRNKTAIIIPQNLTDFCFSRGARFDWSDI